LNAEVEVTEAKAAEGKLAELIDAVQEYRNRQELLIIGEPGSGKSVALRHLALKLLKSPGRTRIPLYVNLREWETDTPGPLIESLKRYIKTVAGRRLETETREFLDAHFDELLDQGRFLLLLDSFDEVPGVLNSQSPDGIKELLDAIRVVFSHTPKRRGILASRPLLGSSLELGERAVTLTIRPFDEDAVKKTLRWHKEGESSAFSDELLRQLFSQPNLAGIANNPFYAWLLRDFVTEHHRLPGNQLELFNAYFEKQLQDSATDRQRRALDAQTTWDVCIRIADTLFDAAQAGAYPPLAGLQALIPDLPVVDVVVVLGPPKLFRSILEPGQVQQNPDARIGFLHRRFQEFLLAKAVLTGRRRLDIDSAVDDPAWSDVLILYCQVCDLDTARRVAGRCWAHVLALQGQRINLRKPAHAIAVRNLQFMTGAFGIGSNRAALDPFRRQIDRLLDAAFHPMEPEPGSGQGKPRVHRYTAGFALDATPLASPDTVAAMLHQALQTGDAGLSEKAFRSCRNLTAVSLPLERSLRAYIDGLPLPVFLRQRRNLLFALSLADAFRPVGRYVQTKWAQFLTWLVLFGVLLLGGASWGVVHVVSPSVLSLSAETQQTLGQIWLILVVVGALMTVWHERFWEFRDWLAERPGAGRAALVTGLLFVGFVFAGLPALYGLIWVVVAAMHWVSGRPDWAPSADAVGLALGVTVGVGAALIVIPAVVSGVRRELRRARRESEEAARDAGQLTGLLRERGLSGLVCEVGGEWGRAVRSFWQVISHRWPLAQLHDFSAWQRVKSIDPSTLEAVETCFLGFRTPAARLRYVVEKLEPLTKPPQGSWRDAVPDLGDDASTRLLALARKWKA
jgi:hypothetical protein